MPCSQHKISGSHDIWIPISSKRKDGSQGTRRIQVWVTEPRDRKAEFRLATRIANDNRNPAKQAPRPEKNTSIKAQDRKFAILGQGSRDKGHDPNVRGRPSDEHKGRSDIASPLPTTNVTMHETYDNVPGSLGSLPVYSNGGEQPELPPPRAPAAMLRLDTACSPSTYFPILSPQRKSRPTVSSSTQTVLPSTQTVSPSTQTVSSSTQTTLLDTPSTRSSSTQTIFNETGPTSIPTFHSAHQSPILKSELSLKAFPFSALRKTKENELRMQQENSKLINEIASLKRKRTTETDDEQWKDQISRLRSQVQGLNHELAKAKSEIRMQKEKIQLLTENSAVSKHNLKQNILALQQVAETLDMDYEEGKVAEREAANIEATENYNPIVETTGISRADCCGLPGPPVSINTGNTKQEPNARG